MHFPSPGVSRLAGTTAALTLIMMAAGAVFTSNQSPEAGRIHQDAALVVGGLTAGLLIWLLPTNTRTWLRGLAWGAVAIFAIEAALSMLQVKAQLPVMQAIAHAVLAPVLLALLVALACFTVPEWQAQPEPVDLSAKSWLPAVAKAAPALVLLQIAMGAGYRHKELGVMPHMAGAMLAAAAMLIIPVMLLQQFPKHPSLKLIATAAMSIALLQVTLGIGAFVMRLLDFDTSPAFIALAVAHVCIGALTLAASLVLAIEITRATE